MGGPYSLSTSGESSRRTWPALRESSTWRMDAAMPQGPPPALCSSSCGMRRRCIMDADQPFADVPIDAVRSYWNARPCNIRHSPKTVGTREYFDEVEQRKYFVEPHIPGFAEFSRWSGKRVLEIGCGIGTDTVNFARAGARLTAVELSDASAEVARQRLQVYGLGDLVTIHVGNAEELPDILAPQT